MGKRIYIRGGFKNDYEYEYFLCFPTFSEVFEVRNVGNEYISEDLKSVTNSASWVDWLTTVTIKYVHKVLQEGLALKARIQVLVWKRSKILEN